MVPKLVDSWLPTPFTAAMIAIAMPAAIRPYSMAVAPDSSFANRAIMLLHQVNSMYTWLIELTLGLSGVLSTATMALAYGATIAAQLIRLQ